MIRSLVALLLLCFGGCQLASALTYKVAGPPKVPAKYTPVKTAPMLVLVENFRQPSASSTEADLLAHSLIEQLEAHKVAPLVDLEKLQALRDQHRSDFSKMSIASIGREVGAAQVLYVQLTNQSITALAGGDTLEGKSTARVKVIDATDGKTLWPTEAEGYEVAAATALGKDRAMSTMDVRQHLCRGLADQIARLLYPWTPDDMSPGTYD